MKKHCVICGKEFITYEKNRISKRASKRIIKRPSTSLTCSSKCSKIWCYKRIKRNSAKVQEF